MPYTSGSKGSAVVEMSYIIPLFLGLFVLIVHAVFYYHDKAVLNAAAAETAVLRGPDRPAGRDGVRPGRILQRAV